MRKEKNATPKGSAIPIADEATLSNDWLQHDDVMKILRVSPNTLKNLRRNKVLPYSKIVGKIYYNSTDVHNMFLHFRRFSLILIAPFSCLADGLELVSIF